MKKIISIFGPPGTGKTRYFSALIKDLSKETTNISAISFTKAAALELTDRIDNCNIRNISTLHSLAFNALQLNRNQIVNIKQFREKNYDNDETQLVNEMLLINDYCVRCGISFGKAFPLFDVGYSFDVLFCCFERYRYYKLINALYDFNDILKNALGKIDPFDYIIIDEAQDISSLHFKFIESLCHENTVLYLAGDDDQCIYQWNGADPNILISKADEKITLKQSYRLPFEIFNFANTLSSKIKYRQEKEFFSRDFKGSVQFITNYNYYELPPVHTILAIDNYILKEIEEELILENISYDKNKGRSLFKCRLANIIRALHYKKYSVLGRNLKKIKEKFHKDIEEKKLKNIPWKDVLLLEEFKEKEIDYCSGVDLFGNTKVFLSTIHGFKGREAENVILLTDFTRKTENTMFNDPDYFYRVIYTGVTRAKKNLFIIGNEEIT